MTKWYHYKLVSLPFSPFDCVPSIPHPICSSDPWGNVIFSNSPQRSALRAASHPQKWGVKGQGPTCRRAIRKTKAWPNGLITLLSLSEVSEKQMASWESLPCAGSHSSEQTSAVWIYNLWHSSKPVQLLAFPTPMNAFLYPMFRKLLITFSKFQLASTRHTHCLLSANMRTQTNLAKIGNSDPFQRQSKYTRAKRFHLNMCSFTQLIAGTQWCWNTKQCRDCVAKGRPQGTGSPSGVQMISKHMSPLGKDTPSLSPGT